MPRVQIKARSEPNWGSLCGFVCGTTSDLGNCLQPMGHGGAGRFGGAASPERQRLPGRCGAELPRKTVSNEHRVDVARSVCRRDGHVRQGAGTHKGDKAMSRSSYPPVRRALDVVAASVAILLLSI